MSRLKKGSKPKEDLKRLGELFQKKQAEVRRIYCAFRALSKRLSLVEEIIASFHPLESPKDFLNKVLLKLQDGIEADAGSIFLKNKEGQLFFAAVSGEKKEEILSRRFLMKEGEGLVGWVTSMDQPLVVHEAGQDERFAKRISEAIGYEVRDVICVPLRTRREVIGAIEFLNKKGGGSFSADDIELLEGISRVVGRFLEVLKRVELLANKGSA